MTLPKHVAKTLKNILDHPMMTDILDKSKDISNIVNEVSNWWKYDLFTRKPGPAYDEDGIFLGTNLDLACFLYELADRKAIINLPEYKNIRSRKIKEGQIKVSNENRHGAILGLNANKETFLFSMKIKDMNIITSNFVGDYRNFSITDFTGNWYDGWKKIDFIPDKEENKFITESKILENNTIIFNNFVSPNRWTSFFGQYYFITKVLIDRLTEEASYYYTETKKMLEEGIRFPERENSNEEEGQRVEREKGKSIKVKAFQVEIDTPKNESVFPTFEHNQENLIKLSDLRRYYIYKLIPKLRFATRATELSYYNSQDNMPSWLENVKWEKDYVVPGKRIKWERLVLFQPGVGERGVSIRKRNYEKSEMVDKDYEAE
jgi:hypothetical protein